MEEKTENMNLEGASLHMDSEEGEGGPSCPGGKTVQASPIEEAVSRLLQKQRSEIMFELRRLQLGDRPVTGQGNKEVVEDFFNRMLQTDGHQPSTANSAQHRPESVVVEVNALVESRPVTSLLQSAGFRRNLESAIRDAIGTVRSRPPQPTVTRSAVTSEYLRHVATPPASSASANQTNSPSTTSQQDLTRSPSTVRISPPTPPTVSRNAVTSRYLSHVATAAESSASSSQASIQSSTSESDIASVSLSAAGAVIPPAPSPPSSLASDPLPGQPQLPHNPSRPVRTEAWLQQQPHQVDFREQRQRTLFEEIEQVHRDDLLGDISDLVQRQLVTQTLDGQFRSVLESHVTERLQATGNNGGRVQEFLQSLPRRDHHRRNDFSDLGIMGAQQQMENIDNISVISATAAVAVPYAQSNVGLSRELKALKAEMQEMRNMMRLSFDLQLDIQRAVRQEVAAALTQVHGSGTPEVSHTAPPRAARESQCLICIDNSVDTVLYQCGHMCVCYTCGMHLRSRGSNCPVCRAPIRDIIRAYKTSVE